MRSTFGLVALLFSTACGPGGAADTQVMMDFSRSGGLYTAPFPSDDLRRADGTIDLSAFPNPDHIEFVVQALATLADARGFAQSSGVFFQTSAALDPTALPDEQTSARASCDASS